jgi:hypothetical protein
MCLITMARPRSDVGRLQYRDVQLGLKDNKPISSIIHFREAKEAQVKSTVLGLMDDKNYVWFQRCLILWQNQNTYEEIYQKIIPSFWHILMTQVRSTR